MSIEFVMCVNKSDFEVERRNYFRNIYAQLPFEIEYNTSACILNEFKIFETIGDNEILNIMLDTRSHRMKQY